jgi:hypothetical protein
MKMEDLCEMIESLVPVHDPENEYKRLFISSDMSLNELADSEFLQNSFARYKKYLTYVDFSEHELILVLINEFLHCENIGYQNIFLAAKCVIIDEKLIEIC